MKKDNKEIKTERGKLKNAFYKQSSQMAKTKYFTDNL